MTGDSLYLDLLKKCLTATIYDESAWVMDDFYAAKSTWKQPGQRLRQCTKKMQHWIANRGRAFETVLVQKRPFDLATAEEGRNWPLFGYSMVGMKRLNNVQQCIENVLQDNVPGDLVETGVWRGGCSILMRAVLKHHGILDRTVWLADSFEGLPPPSGRDVEMSDKDYSEHDYLKVSMEAVQRNFQRFDLLDGQVRFLKGWFKDTLPTAPIDRIALLRLDGDLYSSTLDALTALYKKVSPGGYVILDDYYAWEGCKTAVDEFRAKEHITAELQQIDWTGAFWRVPSP